MASDDAGGTIQTIGQLLDCVREIFRSAARERATDLGPREATLLVQHSLGLRESVVRAFPERPVGEAKTTDVLALAERRAAGEPFAYLTGEREFFGRSFAVTPAVLIPRPETEHLVEAALELPLADDARVLDVGTGSGCIAISAKQERPNWRVDAVDLSLGALAVARANARRLSADIGLVGCDLASALDLGAYDAVLSNPPYVDPGDQESMPVEVREHEPHVALFAADDGLAIYRRLIEACGIAGVDWLVVELGAGQRVAVEELARHHGFRTHDCRADLAGHQRTLVLQQARPSS